MAKKLKVGVIETGIIGKAHVHGYAGMSDDVEIVAVADLDEAEAKRVAEAHDIPNVSTDYKKLLKFDEIDGRRTPCKPSSAARGRSAA